MLCLRPWESGELGGQERASDSTNLAWQRGREWLDLTAGEGAMALSRLVSLLFPRCVAWELWVWELWEWLGQRRGGLLEAGWGQALPGSQGEKNLSVTET